MTPERSYWQRVGTRRHVRPNELRNWSKPGDRSSMNVAAKKPNRPLSKHGKCGEKLRRPILPFDSLPRSMPSWPAANWTQVHDGDDGDWSDPGYFRQDVAGIAE